MKAADLRLDRLRHHHGVRGPLQEAHPARQDPHAERVVPGAAAAAGIRRLRRQHRLQPAAAGRRGLSDGDGRPGFRAVRRVDAQDGRAHRLRQGDRERAHRAGLRDDRPGRQPDLGVSSRGDGQLAPEPRAATPATWRSASSRRTAATAWCSTRRSLPPPDPVHFRPGTGSADVRRRGAADLHRAGDLGRRERLRMAGGAAEDRLDGRAGAASRSRR